MASKELFPHGGEWKALTSLCSGGKHDFPGGSCNNTSLSASHSVSVSTIISNFSNVFSNDNAPLFSRGITKPKQSFLPHARFESQDTMIQHCETLIQSKLRRCHVL
jgi:hypothetical protein